MFSNNIIIEIVVDHNKAYYPGQIVEGQVVCVFKSSKNIRGIILKLSGKEHTSWTEIQGNNTHLGSESHKTQLYIGDNTFLERQEKLTGAGTQNVGTYEFSFKFLLPKNIPSSYQGANGYIKYSLKATVDVPMAFDAKVEKTLHVISLIDLNEIPVSLLPVTLQDEKTIGGWWKAGEPITMRVHMEREAFAIGEDITLKIEVTNMSNISIEQLKVEILHLIEESVKSPTCGSKNSEVVLASKTDTGVGAHGSRTYSISISVPSHTNLMNFENCILFRQQTVLKVEAVVPGFRQNLKVTNVIKLGHVLPKNIDLLLLGRSSQNQPENAASEDLPESTTVDEFTLI